jgi:hypothetical protein
MQIEFNVVETHGDRYFKSSYCSFTYLPPSLAWSGYTVKCTGENSSIREIHVPEFTNLLDGQFQEDGKTSTRLELFHFNVGDKLSIELPDNTPFNFPNYCFELGQIQNSFEANKKLDLVVTEYDGRNFFEAVVGPQVFIFDEFPALPFYYAPYTNGKILRESKELSSFYARNRGGMDCYFHYFENLSTEFSAQSSEAGSKERDIVLASKLQIGDRIELSSSRAFATMLTREWMKVSQEFAHESQRTGQSSKISNQGGQIIIDYASQPK